MTIREIIREIVEPRNENSVSHVYDYLMLIAIVIGIIPLMFREQNKLFWYFDIISVICFMVDYILRWATSDYRSKFKGVIPFVIYPFTPMAIIDLLSILPGFNLLNPTFKVARISRMLKILRVFKIIRYYEPLEIVITVIKKQSKFLMTVMSLAILYIFVTALIMFNAETGINPETGKILFSDFFDAFYWAACTLTTVGYGDFYPVSDLGRLISIISSIVGIAIIALPSGIVTAGYIEEMNSRKKSYKSDKNGINNQ